jgi:hypothetical protein
VFLIALAGCSAPAGAGDVSAEPAGSSEPVIAARKLYINKCARCHKLYDPSNYSDAEWNRWMDKMSRKAKLKPDQKEILSKYIETLRGGAKTNASDSIPAGH